MSDKMAEEVYKKNIGSVVIVTTEAGRSRSRGSGVVVGDNEVVTNCHVVDDGSPIFVQQLEEGEALRFKEFPARIVASSIRDLCLLKTEGLSAPSADIGESKSLDRDDPVYAIGVLNGVYGTLTAGVVLHICPEHIEMTAALAGGSSGGGLFNHEGRLVGIAIGSLNVDENVYGACHAEFIKDLRKRARVEAPLHDDLTAALNAPSADKFRELARRIAESLDHPQAQSLAWSNIGVEETERGDKDLAEPIVEKIRVLAEAHPNFRDQIMVGAIYILAIRGGKGDAEFLKSAQELAGQLGDGQYRAQAAAHIVREVAHNDIDLARKLCENFRLDQMTEAEDTAVRIQVASVYAAMGDSENALRIARSMPGFRDYVETLALIAYESEKQKIPADPVASFGGIMKLAVNPKAVNAGRPVTILERRTALALVAYYAADCGACIEAEEALRIMENCRGNDGNYADDLLRKELVAGALALCGNVEEARQIISRIPVLRVGLVHALAISAIKLSQTTR